MVSLANDDLTIGLVKENNNSGSGSTSTSSSLFTLSSALKNAVVAAASSHGSTRPSDSSSSGSSIKGVWIGDEIVLGSDELTLELSSVEDEDDELIVVERAAALASTVAEKYQPPAAIAVEEKQDVAVAATAGVGVVEAATQEQLGDDDDDDDVFYRMLPTKEYLELAKKSRRAQERASIQMEIQNFQRDCHHAEQELEEVRTELKDMEELCQNVLEEELGFKTALLVPTTTPKQRKVLVDLKEAVEEGQTITKVLGKREHVFHTAHRRNFKLLRKVRDNAALVKVLDGKTPRSKRCSIRWAASPTTETKLIPDRDHMELFWDVPVVGRGGDKHFVTHSDFKLLLEQATGDDDGSTSTTSHNDNDDELKKQWMTTFESTNKRVEEERTKLEERRNSLVVMRKVAEATAAASRTTATETTTTTTTPPPPPKKRPSFLRRRLRRSSSSANGSNTLKKALQEETKRHHKELKKELAETLQKNSAMTEKLNRLETKSKTELERLQNQLSIHFKKRSALDELRASTG